MGKRTAREWLCRKVGGYFLMRRVYEIIKHYPDDSGPNPGLDKTDNNHNKQWSA